MSSSPASAATDIQRSIARMDRWLQTMRGATGYTGPISHWWESSLLYCGPMIDWRYEGIICGYIALFRRTHQRVWLERARTAADDVIAGQLPSGNYRNSAFQQGPMEGGTPHEAAVDVGLLELAMAMRDSGETGWRTYLEPAQRNIESYLIGSLWSVNGFRDQPWNATLVANKNATIIEALILAEAVSGWDMSLYIDGAARVVLAAQEHVGARAGGTVHHGTGRHRLAVGLYTARSMSALLRLHDRNGDDRLLAAVQSAVTFLRSLYSPAGLLFGRYPDGTSIANPRLIAGTGDVLRLMIIARDRGIATDSDVDPLVELLLASQTATGGLPTALGFARRGGRTPCDGTPEFRDVLPVVGWADKAFRALCLLDKSAQIEPEQGPSKNIEVECTWQGRSCTFLESEREIELLEGESGQSIYRWHKTTCYPDVYRL